MKFLTAQLALFLEQRGAKRNLIFLLRFLAMLVILILLYSVIFHVLMEQEGRHFSWITGVYWTLTVMSTLGFGDITFLSDAGRVFSLLVLVSGVLLLLVMLPFAFIQFFYAPWLEAQKRKQAPRELPASTRGHVLVVGQGQLTMNLVDDLSMYGLHCVLLCKDMQTALDLNDQGYNTVVGEHDASNVYSSLQLPQAAMLITLESDVRNTNIAFTARDVDGAVPITASAQSAESIDILRIAGCTHVFQFHRLLGEALARRVLHTTAQSSIICEFEGLVVAEAAAMRSPLVGKTLRESNVRGNTGATVVGLWERGRFRLPRPDTVFTDSMVLVLAGNMEQIARVDAFLEPPNAPKEEEAPIVILGGGRVGMAAARQLRNSGKDYRLVDKTPGRKGRDKTREVIGDAADIDVLQQAGFGTTPSVIITTHDDDTNIYLTLYCRRLRPDVQIISRATFERNVSVLHAAGADLVMSLGNMMTSSIINLLSPGKILMLNEGLNIFRATVRDSLNGKPLLGSGIRSETHCSVLALRDASGVMHVNPDPQHVFANGEELYIIGDSAAEQAYYDKFGKESAKAEAVAEPAVPDIVQREMDKTHE